MMTQCPVRAVMTEIYTLLLELGPCELPSETPSLSHPDPARVRTEAEQFAANALTHQLQDNIVIRDKFKVCVCVHPTIATYIYLSMYHLKQCAAIAGMLDL